MMMLPVFLWTVSFLFSSFVLSESGDDDLLAKEVICTSTLALTQHALSCYLDDDPVEEITFASICKQYQRHQCTNATLKAQYFTFENLQNFRNELQVHLRDVSIPAPEIKQATDMNDAGEIFIWFEHNHPYVLKPKFQVEIWGAEPANKLITFKIDYRNFSISRDRLGGDGLYYTRVRAKPVEYFDGDWSKWSSNVSFSVRTHDKPSLNIPIIISMVLVFLLLFSGFGVFKYRIQIKDYITPSIPHPKATLAQMERAKGGLPFAFSPEIFRDVFIHRVDYVKEKPQDPQLQASLDELPYSWSVCEMDTNLDVQFPKEQSHLKIRLLNESELSKETETSGQTPRQECKDEAYVTMSSLFKTQ
ncbi:hypothetical protein DNTS_004814 [Danionella cerebrum]|uniref:Fibronectin type-III domain-containing protein n=1 Tax=Danionella cerebrum TaxID=2873325 RepID=A0A553RBS0_9TELE|nr:hypothetical protein DNTS_004814 [Danionella translucida]